MNTKFVTILVIAVLAVAGVSVAVISMDDGNDEKPVKTDYNAAAAIYGNADNDSYVDQDDLDFIQSIIDGKIVWDKTSNPYADANVDGKINADDIEQVKMIINNEKGQVYYHNYFGEAQKVSYPLSGKNVAVTYRQQAEAAAILGLWDNVKVANAYVTQVKSNQYDCTGIDEVGTVGSSAKSVNDQGIEIMIKNKIGAIIATPSEAVKEGCAKVTGADAIFLGYSGDDCVPSIITMGILFDAEEYSERYAKLCNDIISYIGEKLENKDKVSLVVTNGYEKIRENVRVCSGYDPDGSASVLKYVSDVYVPNAPGEDPKRDTDRTEEWFIQNDFDIHFITYSSVDQFTYTQEKFNECFEKYIQQFERSHAYKTGGMMATPAFLSGFSAVPMLLYPAWMIYPDIFNLEEAQNLLQYWFDEFIGSNLDIESQAAIFYTGDNYNTRYANTI